MLTLWQVCEYISEMITIYSTAQAIATNGMKESEVFNFFSLTNRGITEYIQLFEAFGVNQNTVWDLYEEWQDI